MLGAVEDPQDPRVETAEQPPARARRRTTSKTSPSRTGTSGTAVVDRPEFDVPESTTVIDPSLPTIVPAEPEPELAPPGPAADRVDTDIVPVPAPSPEVLAELASVDASAPIVMEPPLLRQSRVFGRRPRPRVRRVTRIVRHVDTWSVFKVALVFNVFLYAVLLTSGVLLWQVAESTGTIDNIEKFFESFGWETFEFDGSEIFRNAWVGGLFAVVGLTGLAVLFATLFNLITDLVGGVRFSVLEEEVVARADRGTARHGHDGTGGGTATGGLIRPPVDPTG
jgi:hypothetical protein